MSEILQAQCWICPHCYNDEHHQSDSNGCEWQDKPLSLVVSSCRDCPFYRLYDDNCSFNYFAFESGFFEVGFYYENRLTHPDCSLKSKSILISFEGK